LRRTSPITVQVITTGCGTRLAWLLVLHMCAARLGIVTTWEMRQPDAQLRVLELTVTERSSSYMEVGATPCSRDASSLCARSCSSSSAASG